MKRSHTVSGYFRCWKKIFNDEGQWHSYLTEKQTRESTESQWIKKLQPFWCEKGIFQEEYIKTMSDALAPCVSNMMTSSNGNIFCVTGLLCGEFTDDWWIPRTKASDAELWGFLWSAWINGRVNNREAGNLRGHHTHYDVTVMKTSAVMVLVMWDQRIFLFFWICLRDFVYTSS